MADLLKLEEQLKTQCADWLEETKFEYDELTIVVKREHLLDLCQLLRDGPSYQFSLLVDVCGVDYLQYGLDDWETESSTATGFSRGITDQPIRKNPAMKNRFAVVYHLLSLSRNSRLRLKVNLADEHELLVDSLVELWPAANWFEREVFDLFGILFKNHPDLRRLLTDYGFNGHPFRKDFPLIGKVEARYDAGLDKVVYEPVSIVPRILEPKVIRSDNRYQVAEAKELKDAR